MVKFSRRNGWALMIDNFSLGLAHALMLYAAWRLLSRPDLDRDGDAPEAPRWGRRG